MDGARGNNERATLGRCIRMECGKVDGLAELVSVDVEMRTWRRVILYHLLYVCARERSHERKSTMWEW